VKGIRPLKPGDGQMVGCSYRSKQVPTTKFIRWERKNKKNVKGEPREVGQPSK